MTQLPGHLAKFTWGTYSRHVAAEYGIKDESAIWELIEQLDGVRLLFVDAPYVSAEALTLQRKNLYKTAKAIVAMAAKLTSDFAKLRNLLSQFDQSILMFGARTPFSSGGFGLSWATTLEGFKTIHGRRV